MSLGYVRKLRHGRRLFARPFDCGSHVLSALECTSDVVVIGAAVEREQLQTMRTLHLKAIANPLDPLAKHDRAVRAFDFNLSFNHRCASDDRASYHAKLTVLLKAQSARGGRA